jgi:periplasmic protein CpxP/Spy
VAPSNASPVLDGHFADWKEVWLRSSMFGIYGACSTTSRNQFLGGKMSNSRWSILTILVLLAAGLTFAQTSQESQAPTPDKHAGMHHNGDDADQHLQMLSDKLNLTDDQKAKIKPVFQGQMQQMNAVREDSSLSQEQKRAKMKSIHESLHDQINAVLTPEQQAKFEQLRQEQMEKHKGMKEGKMDHE